MAGTRQLESQLRRRYPMLRYFTDRPFGVEIEICGLDYVTTPLDNGIIKPYNISSKSLDGKRLRLYFQEHNFPLGDNRDEWHFEEDSSIIGRGGAELISPVLQGLPGLMQVYKAFALLRRIHKLRIDQSCGFHVHHGVAPPSYDCSSLGDLVRLVYPLEQYFYLLIPGDRSQAATCRPMEIDVSEVLAACNGNCDKSRCRIKELWYSADNRYDAKAAARYDKTRYHGLNLHSFWFRSTVEFRYHSAVMDDIHGAIQWIIFTQFLVEASAGRLPKLYIYPGMNKWMQAMYKIYLARGYLNRIQYGGSHS